MDKLERSIGGIKDMGGLPEALFIIDVNNEKIAVAEARKMRPFRNGSSLTVFETFVVDTSIQTSEHVRAQYCFSMG